jgi:hypothetical protein
MRGVPVQMYAPLCLVAIGWGVQGGCGRDTSNIMLLQHVNSMWTWTEAACTEAREGIQVRSVLSLLLLCCC